MGKCLAIEDEHFLSDALDFVSHDAQLLALDSVYCHLFNAAGGLEGNTEASDVEWFARQMYEEAHGWTNTLNCPGWEHLPDADREFWLGAARAALARLPFLMSRIAHRCRVTAQAVNSLLRAERAKERGGR